MNVTGRLENWYWDSQHDVIWGNLYDDTRERWREGQHIRTSYIQERKEFKQGDIVETLNSTYLLGKPRV